MTKAHAPPLDVRMHQKSSNPIPLIPRPLRHPRSRKERLLRRFCWLLVFALAACSAPAATRRTPTPAPTVIAFQGRPSASAAPAPLSTAAANSTVQPPVSAPTTPTTLLALAYDQRNSGEYAALATTLQALAAQPLDAATAREVQFRLAEAAFLGGNPDAGRQLAAFVDASPTADDWQARALFLWARTQENAGQHQQAVMTYARYRDLHTPLEAYAALRAAAQQAAAGDLNGQTRTLEWVAAQPIAAQTRAAVLEQLMQLAADAGQRQRYLTALVAVATKPAYRAEVLWRAAQGADAAQRRAWLTVLVNELPLESQAPDAVAALAADGAPVAPYLAGRIFFWHDRWRGAVAQFDAALQTALSAREQFEARRLRGLALRGLGDFDGALAELGALAQVQPASPASLQAELDYVQTVGQSSNVGWAIGGYQRFAANHPDSALAPEALWRVVQLQETGEAMGTALALGRAYGQSTQAHTALSQAGLYFYRNNDRAQAIEAWRLLAAGATGWDAAEGGFWSGAALLEAGDRAGAAPLLQRAVAAAPHSYYGVRARELLKLPDAALLPPGSAPTAEEQAQAEAWLRSWGVATLPPAAEIADDPAVQRARMLDAVDLRSEARDEWLWARDQWNDQPGYLWQLALQATNEQPYAALKAAERIVQQSPAKRIAADTPTGLLRLIYPVPYAGVVRTYARLQAVDPRLLFALLRQESLFNPDATSWVGARGLAQVMPATGEGIASALDVADWDASQLYQPAVSVRFGAYYMGEQLRAFGQAQAAAAAYNGGPGNAARWQAITTDPDMFAEVIDFPETQEYVKIVYGNWGMYRMLWSE